METGKDCCVPGKGEWDDADGQHGSYGPNCLSCAIDHSMIRQVEITEIGRR